MTKLGYQIPNFTYPDTAPHEIFGRVVDQAKAAEAAGFDRTETVRRSALVTELASSIVN